MSTLFHNVDHLGRKRVSRFFILLLILSLLVCGAILLSFKTRSAVSNLTPLQSLPSSSGVMGADLFPIASTGLETLNVDTMSGAGSDNIEKIPQEPLGDFEQLPQPITCSVDAEIRAEELEAFLESLAHSIEINFDMTYRVKITIVPNKE